MSTDPNIPHREITYKIISAAMRVHSRLGPGLREKHYQKALTAEMISANLSVAEEYHLEIYDGETWMGRLYLDHFVEECVVVEIKAFSHEVTKDEKAQVISYLAATGSQVGLLLNFGRKKLEHKRILLPKSLAGWQDRIQRFLWQPKGQRILPKRERQEQEPESAFPIPMRCQLAIDTTLPSLPLTAIPAQVRSAEAMGFDAVWATETQHDPFLPGPLIAEHTEKLNFGTAVAIGFARSPATLAYTAWDLAQASGGRFILGLGTQVKGHIERRFGMEWPASAVGKLREQIQAIRAFWNTWQTGERLNFRGEYYKLTLMTPFFDPGPIDHPEIPIYIAGVNTGLARLAGEVADGFHVHPLNSARYLREILLPAIETGARKNNRTLDDITVSTTAFVVTSPEEKNVVRMQIAFYASTPSYRRVFALHGWESIAEKLSGYAVRKQWDAMGGLITDEILSTFAVFAEPDEVASALLERYQGLTNRLTLYTPFIPGERDAFWRKLIATLTS